MTSTCCHLHREPPESCCDPNDCGPCCDQCPTCPTLLRQREANFRAAYGDAAWQAVKAESQRLNRKLTMDEAAAVMAPANDNAGPFNLGSDVWPGLAKLAEEAGEVVQVIGKLIATGGRADHWSGRNLAQDLDDELADLQAAIDFVRDHNMDRLNDATAGPRWRTKRQLFEQWHGGSGGAILTGGLVPGVCPVCGAGVDHATGMTPLPDGQPMGWQLHPCGHSWASQ